MDKMTSTLYLAYHGFKELSTQKRLAILEKQDKKREDLLTAKKKKDRKAAKLSRKRNRK